MSTFFTFVLYTNHIHNKTEIIFTQYFVSVFLFHSILKVRLGMYNVIRNLRRQKSQLQTEIMKLKKSKVCSPPSSKCRGRPSFIATLPSTSSEVQSSASDTQTHVVTVEIHPQPSTSSNLAEPVQDAPPDTETPRKSAKQFMRSCGLSPTRHPDVAKEITAFHTLSSHIKKAPPKLRKTLLKKRTTQNKGRCASHLSRRLKVHRRSVFATRKSVSMREQTHAWKRNKVHSFLKQAENSTLLAGKQHVLKGGNVQRYTLNDTIGNLFSRFKEQNPNIKMGRATFSRLRPAWMKPIQWATRRQCLCHVHQNASLKLKAIHVKDSPNVFLDKHDADSINTLLESLPPHPIKYKVWQKEEIMYENTAIKKLRLQSHEVSQGQFCEMFKSEFTQLREHVRRVKTQYVQLDNLKMTLEPRKELTCQIDYSENYACSFQDEPSQVFFDRQQITLHPMVLHYKDEENTLKHKSFVGITDEKSHAAPTTLAFLTKLMSEVKANLPGIQIMHYISDSPSSQYRNRSIVKFIANHAAYFEGVNATWDYLESGHGKGPCDGVGGSLKKSADLAVKKGEIINGASSFFEWAQRTDSSITCLLVKQEDIAAAEKRLRNPVNVKGISSVHSLRPYNNCIWMRETSCYQPCCAENPSCPGWLNTGIQINNVETPAVEEDRAPVPVTRSHKSSTPDMGDSEPTQSVTYEVDDLVEFQYKKRNYIGKILDVSEEEHEYLISFMRKVKNKYVWPKQASEAWVVEAQIAKSVTMKDGVLHEK